MRSSQKSKKVTWPSDDNLCQVRLFSPENCPSGIMRFDEDLPPGFEQKKPANLRTVKWKCPPIFEVNSDWQVVSGEESSEIEAQNQREIRVLEAIYPHPSSIPLNPSSLVRVEEDSNDNDQNTPLIPLKPIEDEDSAFDTITPRTMGPDVVPYNNMRSSIDTQLLIKILTDPKVVDEIVKNYRLSRNVPILPSSVPLNVPNIPSSNTTNTTSFFSMSSNTLNMPNIPSSNTTNTPSFLTMPSTTTQYKPQPSSSVPLNMTNIPSSNTTNTPTSTTHSMPFTMTQYRPQPSMPMIPNGHFYPPSSSIGSSMGEKDINYYKSLIQQYGQEKREILPQFVHQNTTKIAKSKPKIMKKCMYFNTARGCRNGANCPYEHDLSSRKRISGVSEVQIAKKVKLDKGSITCP